MDHTVCPGAKFLRQPRPEIFPCPDCGAEVEIWSDEIRGTCSACGRNVFREGVPSCVEWCKYGEECVGEEAFGTYRRNRALGIRRRLLEMLEERELADPGQLEACGRAADWAEAILEREPGEWHLVIPAVIVHDVVSRGSVDAEMLRRLLAFQGLDPDDVGAVRSIVESARERGAAEEANARIVQDAWTLAAWDEKPRRGAAAAELQRRLCTDAARSLSRERERAAGVGPRFRRQPTHQEHTEDSDA
jgi:hypothetical protein